MRSFLLTVFIAILTFSQGFLAAQSLPLPAAKHKLVVIAHRGSHLKVPENTLAAYDNAIKGGADYVEIDLRTTKDGHLVIMHDASVTRMTGRHGNIKDLNYSDIKELRIKPAGKQDTIT
ncbi:MAG: glycerophosphodiester phosphodiesterase family protein, partial [Bacteroidota bacterium]|nr:glycerophosphodiester phosphodiesterase family protein [Bacteroidota bacterium]